VQRKDSQKKTIQEIGECLQREGEKSQEPRGLDRPRGSGVGETTRVIRTMPSTDHLLEEKIGTDIFWGNKEGFRNTSIGREGTWTISVVPPHIAGGRRKRLAKNGGKGGSKRVPSSLKEAS